jgi:surfactin synthase thioesterase subunit
VLEGLGIASPSATSRTAQRVEAGVARARRYRPAPMALPIDLHVAYGTHDPLVTEEVVAGWQGQGARRLHLHRIEGDHLFHQTTGGRLGEVLGLALLRLT